MYPSNFVGSARLARFALAGWSSEYAVQLDAEPPFVKEIRYIYIYIFIKLPHASCAGWTATKDCRHTTLSANIQLRLMKVLPSERSEAVDKRAPTSLCVPYKKWTYELSKTGSSGPNPFVFPS